MQTDDLHRSSQDRMLAAASRLFALHGFVHTSTAQVAREAGTSESQLIKHFGSKEGLLNAVFDAMWRGLNLEMATLIAGDGTAGARLRTLVRVMLTRLEKQPEVKQLMLFEGRRMRAGGLVVTAGFRQFVDRLDGLLRQARRAGEFREDLPVPVVRALLIGAFEGLLRDRLMARHAPYPAAYSARDVQRAMYAVIDRFVAS